MLGDIATGHTWGADVCFLLALIGFVVAGVLYAAVRADTARWAPVVLSLGAGFVALGFLLL
jgi:hypothetical protein